MPSLKPTAAALALALVLGAGPVAAARQELTIGSATAVRGQTVTLSLGYAGDGSAAGLQLDVTFDPAVLGAPSVAAGTGLGGKVLRSATVASGRLRLVVYSPVNAAVGDGELARLAFSVNGSAPLGTSTVALAGVVLGNANASAIATTALANGTIMIIADPGTSFYTVAPCRLVDTRNPSGPLAGPALLTGQRTFILAGACNVPITARALSINVTVVQPAAGGDLRLFPADLPKPLTSVVNFRAGQTRTNNAIIGLSAAGALSVQNDAPGAVDLLIDVNGYFQ
jgi:hypothetical protein